MERAWLRKVIAIEEVWNTVQSKLIRLSTPKLDGDAPGTQPQGVQRVYDKDAGGILGAGAGQAGGGSQVEQFAAFANTPKPTMTVAELRAAAARLAEQAK